MNAPTPPMQPKERTDGMKTAMLASLKKMHSDAKKLHAQGRKVLAPHPTAPPAPTASVAAPGEEVVEGGVPA